MRRVEQRVFQVGDLLLNRLTREKGQVARLVNSQVLPIRGSKETGEVAYIVSLPATDLNSAREALWHGENCQLTNMAGTVLQISAIPSSI
jgi:hypothetical protein